MLFQDAKSGLKVNKFLKMLQQIENFWKIYQK